MWAFLAASAGCLHVVRTVDSWLCCLSEAFTWSDVAGCSRWPINVTVITLLFQLTPDSATMSSCRERGLASMNEDIAGLEKALQRIADAKKQLCRNTAEVSTCMIAGYFTFNHFNWHFCMARQWILDLIVSSFCRCPKSCPCPFLSSEP